MTKAIALPFALLFGWTALGVECLDFNGGTCRAAQGGGFELSMPQGVLKINPTWVTPGWGFNVVSDAKQEMRKEGDSLILDFEATVPETFKTQDDLPMLVIVNGEGKAYAEGLFRIGDSVASLAMNCVWGHGTTFESDVFKLRFKLAEAQSLSFWNIPDRCIWNIRVPSKKKPCAKGMVRYSQRLSLVPADVTIPRPPDVVRQKREQYRRVLAPPQETGFDRGRWLEVCESPKTDAAAFARLEALFDARSDLYSLADRWRHQHNRNSDGEKLIARAYAALKEMDVESVRNCNAQLRKIVESNPAAIPLARFSPYSWIKSYTQWGFARAPDGHGNFEPNPWNAQWQDGYRFNLDQDPRIAVANSRSAPGFYETRYLEPVQDVSFERDWVSTKWHFADGKTITYSVLTPIIDVDGISELKLSGFSNPPDRVLSVDTRGRVVCRQLTQEAHFEPELIPSALMDFTKPPPAAIPPSTGEVKVEPESVGRPWLRLLSATDRGIILLPGARPVSMLWQNGVFTLKLARKSYVGIVRAQDNLYSGEQPEMAEFFAAVAAAYPDACREAVKNERVGWAYTHRVRRNDWDLAPHHIAPVPPLADLAEMKFANVKRSKYPSKWGAFRYAEGKAVAGRLPDGVRREDPSLSGVNASIWEEPGHELAIITNVCSAVRLITIKEKTVEESCERFETFFKFFRKHGIRAVIDAHNSVYGVWWQDGIGPCEDFVAMWDAFSRVGAKYPDVVVGYDIYNEPGTSGGSEEIWRDVCARAARAIHANHPKAKVYFPALAGGNPNGLTNLRPLPADCEPQVMTYHFYSPHSFTHQKCSTRDVGGDTCVFYPAWAYPNDWSVGHHFGGTTVDWFDRWTLGAMLLPAFEHYAQWNVPQHVGEFAVIGYADGKSPRSAFAWTRDSVELFEHCGAIWHLWNGGFGLGNKFVREWLMQRKSRRQTTAGAR